MDKPEVEDLGDEFRVMVQVHDLERNVSIWAGTHQPKMQTFRDRNRKPELDPYAFEKAISKAQRNALKNLMPVTMVEAAIARFTALPAGSPRPERAATKGGQASNGAKGTGEIPEGQPKDVGLLFTWSYQSFGYYQPTVLEIVGAAKAKDIKDLKAAWEAVKTHAAANGATEPEEPATDQDGAAPAESVDYPETNIELSLWAEQAYGWDAAHVKTILGKPIAEVEDIKGAWDQILAAAKAPGPDVEF